MAIFPGRPTSVQFLGAELTRFVTEELASVNLY
jgi:hypothetical protein